MPKRNKSVTVDEDVDEYLGQEHVNASGLVNQLVKNHMTGEEGAQQMLRLRIEQEKDELDALESRVEKKRKQVRRLEDRLEEYSDTAESVLADAADTLTEEQLDEENPAVRNFAGKTTLSVSEFLDRLRDEMEAR